VIPAHATNPEHSNVGYKKIHFLAYNPGDIYSPSPPSNLTDSTLKPSISPVYSSSWQGSLSLEFARRADKTILSRERVQAPLKLQRPFYPEGEQVCHGVMLHTAGGVVGGDQLSIQVQLQPDTEALLTTAAATKIYRTNGLEAEQRTHIQVDAGACLEWLPQETIVFNGALYRQQLKVELAADAIWLGWDITRLGRSARGERFTEGEWRSRTEVWQAGKPIWIDPQRLRGESESMASLHGLAGYPVVGNFALIGLPISDQLLQKVRAVSLPDSAIPFAGVTRLQSGLLCRYRGDSSAAARRWFMQIWQVLRPEYLGRPSCIPRVWQL
jgi:urease accessory protein